MVANESEVRDVVSKLANAIGKDYVITDEADREFYAMDVYSFREMPLAVVQPGSLSDMVEISRIAAAEGHRHGCAWWWRVLHRCLSAQYTSFIINRYIAYEPHPRN